MLTKLNKGEIKEHSISSPVKRTSKATDPKCAPMERDCNTRTGFFGRKSVTWTKEKEEQSCSRMGKDLFSI